MRTAPLILLLLAACAKDPPPIAVDSGCEKLQRKDFTDPGLKAQSDPNIRADIGNENWWRRDCGPPSGLKPGPK